MLISWLGKRNNSCYILIESEIMEKQKNIHELAIHYFEGRIRRVDESRLFTYIEQSEANRATFRQWEKEWTTAEASSGRTTKEWETLQRKICTQEAIRPMLAHPKSTISSFSIWRKIAAVAAIVILTIGGTLSVWHFASSLKPETYFVCEAPYGEKSKVILSDGTIVWLNAGSTLKYSNKFNASYRRVELNGEGYFEVSRKNGTAFIVQTRGYDVVVKGTKFDVSAYDDDPFISTTLLEGSVELNYQGNPIIMYPGESMRLNVETGKFIRTTVNASQSKAWAENRIEFDHITLKELVAKLSRQYDVDIRLESEEVGNKIFRISLRNEETIGEVMTALQEILPITIERKDKDIYIRE